MDDLLADVVASDPQIGLELWMKVTTTMRRVATRRISRSPASTSVQWWIVMTAMAASKESSGNGRCSAAASTAGPAPAGRWPIITADGSTAVTSRSRGSYEPVPAPTLTTVRASPSAARIGSAGRGS